MIFSNKKIILLSISCIFFLFLVLNSKLILEYLDFFGCIFIREDNLTKIDRNFKFDELIAHAGGSVNGLTYTNSLEALNINYNEGFRFFEIDLYVTNDNKILLYHNYKKSLDQNELKLLLEKYSLSAMTIEDLCKWVSEKPDVYIITHVRQSGKNIDIMKLISLNYHNVIDRFIPQVYSFKEYFSVRKLGFDKIIFSIYLKKYSNGVIVKFIDKYPISALTMPANRVYKDFIKQVNDHNTLVFVHTVNDLDEMNVLKSLGVYGFYTDFIKINPAKRDK